MIGAADQSAVDRSRSRPASMCDSPSAAHLNGPQAPAVSGVHAAPNHVAITIVLVRIAVSIGIVRVVSIGIVVTVAVVVISIRSVEAAERETAPEATIMIVIMEFTAAEAAMVS